MNWKKKRYTEPKKGDRIEIVKVYEQPSGEPYIEVGDIFVLGRRLARHREDVNYGDLWRIDGTDEDPTCFIDEGRYGDAIVFRKEFKII